MKTEDDPLSLNFIAAVPPVSADAACCSSASSCSSDDTPDSPADPCASDHAHAHASTQPPASVTAAVAPSSRSRTSIKAARKPKKTTGKTNVCDNCRDRRIKCDYELPCKKCIDSRLVCKRTYQPRKRGPKTGNGRVINSLRESQKQEAQANAAANASHVSQPQPWLNDVATGAPTALEPIGLFTSDQYQPRHRPYIALIPRCVELFWEHIYPIMPMVYMPTIRTMIQMQMSEPEKAMIYALCAMVCLHISGKSLHIDGPESWEDAGRFFLDECVSTRNRYDYRGESSLETTLSSFWLSTSSFEIFEDRKSWVYLREALTFAEDLGLHDDATYRGLSPTEILCRQRVFWILFVTERSFAVFRKKSITLRRTPTLPDIRHGYESPDIHTGFMHVVRTYTPLDESFVSAWNNDSDSRVTADTFLALQSRLSQPPFFPQRSRASTPSSSSDPIYSAPVTAAPSLTGSDEEADEEIVHSEPTNIQKADLMITQQWLRLIVWRSSEKQRLLSWNSQYQCMDYAFPLEIARATANVLQSLPSSAVEVHGMGMFEKIFEIGSRFIGVLDQMDRMSAAGSTVNGISGAMGMDFVGTDDLGVLSLSRRGIAVDPIEVFVRTLSATPNSRTRFADELLKMTHRPGVMKMALTPPLTAPESLSWTNDLSGVSNSVAMNGVVKEENGMDTEGSNGWSLGNVLNLDGVAASSSLVPDPTFDFNTSPFHTDPSNAPRPADLTQFSLSSLETSIQPIPTWENETTAAAQNWSSYALISPTDDSATFANNTSAYTSAAGTTVGNFMPNVFPRQSSGDGSSYQYQHRQQLGFGANLITGSHIRDKEKRVKPTHLFSGNLEWPSGT